MSNNGDVGDYVCRAWYLQTSALLSTTLNTRLTNDSTS